MSTREPENLTHLAERISILTSDSPQWHNSLYSRRHPRFRRPRWLLSRPREVLRTLRVELLDDRMLHFRQITIHGRVADEKGAVNISAEKNTSLHGNELLTLRRGNFRDITRYIVGCLRTLSLITYVPFSRKQPGRRGPPAYCGYQTGTCGTCGAGNSARAAYTCHLSPECPTRCEAHGCRSVRSSPWHCARTTGITWT